MTHPFHVQGSVRWDEKLENTAAGVQETHRRALWNSKKPDTGEARGRSIGGRREGGLHTQHRILLMTKENKVLHMDVNDLRHGMKWKTSKAQEGRGLLTFAQPCSPQPWKDAQGRNC